MQITSTAETSADTHAVGPARDNINTGSSDIPTAGMKDASDSETSDDRLSCPAGTSFLVFGADASVDIGNSWFA
jgi:hypothetical protein